MLGGVAAAGAGTDGQTRDVGPSLGYSAKTTQVGASGSGAAGRRSSEGEGARLWITGRGPDPRH